MLKFAYHTHSIFCDGKNSLKEMVLAALEKGLTHYGFSSHAPVPFENGFAIRKEQTQAYLQQCRKLKEEYKNRIRLYTSMEFDYITGIVEDAAERAKGYNLDYVIASVHSVSAEINGERAMWFIDGGKQDVYDEGLERVFGGDIRKGVEAFFSQTCDMIRNVQPDIVAHLDKIKMHNRNRYFHEDDKWYEDLVMQTLEVISKSPKTVIEVNTRGLYKGRADDYFPSRKWLKHIRKMNIPITISTDCHNVTEIDNLFAETWQMLSALGFKHIWYYEDEWKKYKIK
ncbi:MAG: histidinol-phosphatase [Bacteroidales bacterium]|jgi:histidinol-phosphatase (PHP family)|nr:histidinol-phosphatase [Bacteroidales bacterium]